jgi:hypothetical protein
MNSSMEGYYTCYANNIVTNEYHLYMTGNWHMKPCFCKELLKLFHVQTVQYISSNK